MDYGRFEKLVIALGTLVIVTSMFLSPGSLILQEVIAQLLIIAVLVGAVHWGRNGGFALAVVATLIYILLLEPLLAREGLSSPMMEMVLARMLAYGAVGVLGGEISERLKVFFTRIEKNAVLDESTNVYNACFIGKGIRSETLRFERYQIPASVLLLELAPEAFMRARSTSPKMMHRVAKHIRDNVRVIDDVGFIQPRQFVVLLGQTPHTGAEVTADRLRRGVRDLLNAPDASVSVTVLTLPEDLDALTTLADELCPVAAESTQLSASEQTA